MISVSNVKKSYIYGETKIEVLHNIDLEIRDGEVIAIMGESGSGKSTLLNIIGGLIDPSEGAVSVNDIVISKLNDKKLADFRNREYGYVFQKFYLIKELTALENVLLPLQYNKDISYKEGVIKAKDLLTKVGMGPRIDYKPGYMSGGEQQRVAIARAVINNPSIILADEPTGSLDSKMSRQIMTILLDLAKRNKMTLIVVTHDPNVAKQADRIVFISDGTIKEQNYIV